MELFSNFHMTLPIKHKHFIMRITRGRQFTPIEKMVKPFDNTTWIVTSMTFIAGFFLCFVMSFMSQHLKDFVFGRLVHYPSTSILQIFFGIGVVSEPGRNFSRFMFTLFTILCLILRTAYQGKMFDLLQYDVRQPDANSIQEVVDRKIPVYHQLIGVFYSNETTTVIEEIWYVEDINFN